jgi:hypothetical protein
MSQKLLPSYDLRIACNFPEKTYQPHATAITDYPVLRRAIRDKRLFCPVITTNRALRKVRKAKCDVLETLPYLQMKSIHPSIGINSGQLAALYAAKHSKEIHLYGFDSVFYDDLSSSTDSIIPHSSKENLVKIHKTHIVWRKYWNHILTTHSQVNFIFITENQKLESRTGELFTGPEGESLQ